MGNRFFLFLFVVLFFSSVVVSQGSVSDSSFGDKIVGEGYEISREKVERVVTEGTIFEDFVEILSQKNAALRVSFSVSSGLEDIITSVESGITIEPRNASRWYFNVEGRSLGSFAGDIELTGDVSTKIPVNITVTNNSLNPLFLLEISLREKVFLLTEPIDFDVELKKLKPVDLTNLTLYYSLVGPDNDSFELFTESINLPSSIDIPKQVSFPEDAKTGLHTLVVRAVHDGKEIVSRTNFDAKIPLLSRKLFGFFPVWLLFTILGVLAVGAITFYLIRRHILSKQKYKMRLDMKTLPKKDKSFLWLGKIAEKKHFAYLDPHRLTTHAIIAGATGGGKSITSQVLIEEALKQNISVLVFDPTAQWSGMLRKCEDKKMFAYYPKFGMKTSEARGFPGNIRAIKDARQVVEVEKFFEPGHIQIFTLNKLQPKDMDIFVANTIRQIFQSDPKEYPTLRMLLVFDEVHRLLPKFGGSGEGFVQIERACREFRKWGYGVMLISQVLNDFVGEIKANISTEIQMRTRDEGDLNRIKTKFGDEFLQSLVKASSGVGMFVNPAYNHANPYFVNFRPILHNTRRLPDEELEKYNQYNDTVDDLEYQIEQLEELKVDVFDLKMELKLVKDKIMTGNFSVVDIYLEGLTPRIAKQWEKLGKKPKKKELKLASLEEIKASVEEAKKESEKAKAKEAAQEAAATEAKRDPMEELNNKQLNPLTFDNGIMVSTLKEMKEVLPNLDSEIFQIHVNKEKNDIATWFEQISKPYGARLKSVIEKEELLKQINDYKPEEKPAEKSAEQTTDKKEEKKQAPTKAGETKEKSGEEKPVEKEEKKVVVDKKPLPKKELPKEQPVTEKVIEQKPSVQQKPLPKNKETATKPVGEK